MFDIANNVMSNSNPIMQYRAMTEEKIKNFLTKPVGWHYGQGKPPSARRVTMAIAYLSILDALNLRQTDAFPGIDGEIMIRAYQKEIYFSLSIEVDYKTVLSVDGSDGEDFEGESLSILQSIKILKTKLEEINKKQCDTRDWSIPSTMTEGQNPSLTMHLKTVPTGAAHPLLVKIVSPPAANLYASTLGTTTQISLPLHQYSGRSTHLYSDALAA